MGFYIRYETHQDGPYDLVTMIRKIRKGLLPAETLVMEESDSQAISARLHPQLNSFYQELDEDYVSPDASDTIAQVSFGKLLRYGADFFSHNLISGMFAAIFLFASFLASFFTLLLLGNHIITAMLIIATCVGLFLCGFVFMMQQLQRQLPFSFAAIGQFYVNNWKNLLLFSICFSLITLTGLAFFIVPGVLILGRMAFAPMLVIDRNFHFWHAIESSERTVKKHGKKLYMLLIGLVCLNILAAVCFIFPLLITLPLSFAALLEIYDQLDFK